MPQQTAQTISNRYSYRLVCASAIGIFQRDNPGVMVMSVSSWGTAMLYCDLLNYTWFGDLYTKDEIMICTCCKQKRVPEVALRIKNVCLDCTNYITGWQMKLIEDKDLPAYVADYMVAQLHLPVNYRKN